MAKSKKRRIHDFLGLRKISKGSARLGKTAVIISAAAAPALIASTSGGNSVGPGGNPIANPSQYVYQYTGFNAQSGQVDQAIIIRNVTLVVAALITAKIFGALSKAA